MIEGATGKFLLQQMAAVAELEAGMISARAAGRAALQAQERAGAIDPDHQRATSGRRDLVCPDLPKVL